jgi:hypothetical protein
VSYFNVFGDILKITKSALSNITALKSDDSSLNEVNTNLRKTVGLLTSTLIAMYEMSIIGKQNTWSAPRRRQER